MLAVKSLANPVLDEYLIKAYIHQEKLNSYVQLIHRSRYIFVGKFVGIFRNIEILRSTLRVNLEQQL